jgi:hypothetical protein
MAKKVTMMTTKTTTAIQSERALHGRTSGRCPGYVIDHINPLECGGADAPGNMQWQTVTAGKTKDKTEGMCR